MHLLDSFLAKQPIPRLQHKALGAVFAELALFVGLEHAEGFAGVIGAHQVDGVEDVAQFVAAEAVEVGVEGEKFGLYHSAMRAGREIAGIQPFRDPRCRLAKSKF